MKHRRSLCLVLVLVAPAVAQTPVPVPRPATPSATTLASTTSQIAAWYRYAVYQEQLVAELKATGDAAIVARLTAIETKLNAPIARMTITVASPNSIATGSTVHLTATSDGAPAPTWQWKKDGVAVPGATNPALTFTATTSATYTATATNVAGSASASVTVTVSP